MQVMLFLVINEMLFVSEISSCLAKATLLIPESVYMTTGSKKGIHANIWVIYLQRCNIFNVHILMLTGKNKCLW